MLPRDDTSTGWHQDNHYFGTDSDRVASCGIYLEDAAGQGKMAHGNWTEVDETEAKFVKCPAGTVVLFSASLLHGAGTNDSNRSRHSTACHYIPADMELKMFPFCQYKDHHGMTDLAPEPTHAGTLNRMVELLEESQKKFSNELPLRVDDHEPMEVTIGSEPRRSDGYQPEWIREKYF